MLILAPYSGMAALGWGYVAAVPIRWHTYQSGLCCIRNHPRV